MEGSAYVDPLAGVFPTANKSRFAHVKWPTWDHGIFNRDNIALENAHELAFFAGYRHALSTLSLNRPKELIHLLDTATLNFIGRFGLTGFKITREDVFTVVQGNKDLVVSYYCGVLYVIEWLREAAVPKEVNEQDLKEFLRAYEVYTDEQLITMMEIGPQVAEEVETANDLKKLTALRIVDSVSEEEEQPKDDTPVFKFGTLVGDKVVMDEGAWLDARALVDRGLLGAEHLRQTGEDGDENVTYVVVAKDDEEDDEHGNGDESPAGKESEGELGGEKEEEAAVEAEATESKPPAKWAKSKKAKKAKALAKREKKAAAEKKSDEA